MHKQQKLTTTTARPAAAGGHSSSQSKRKLGDGLGRAAGMILAPHVYFLGRAYFSSSPIYTVLFETWLGTVLVYALGFGVGMTIGKNAGSALEGVLSVFCKWGERFFRSMRVHMGESVTMGDPSAAAVDPPPGPSRYTYGAYGGGGGRRAID